jgi:hypothetical protein
VLGWALGLRVLFALLTAGTYEPDEFVLLALGNRFAHGAVPYRDFMFFHPPGALVLYRALQPLIALWWPLARVFSLLVDSVTAALVWKIGLALYGRRGGLAAGLVYGASPLALISAVRVGQDPLITFLGVAGLALLVTQRSTRAAVLAGACLGIAVWIKYPALLFLPVYVLAAPRRAAVTVLAAVVSGAIVFAPFAPTAHALIQQTVVWQRNRYPMPLDIRVAHDAVFWLLLNPLAIPGLLARRAPLWVIAGFLLGGLFVLTPDVYYHYLVPIVPFAALLAAAFLDRTGAWFRRVLLAAGLAATVLCGLLLASAGNDVRQLVTAARFAWVRPVVQILDRSPAARAGVLADRFEYAYLAGRPDASTYFWDLRTEVTAARLERYLPRIALVVETTGHGPGFPDGFVAYLRSHHYRPVHTIFANVWVRRQGARA